MKSNRNNAIQARYAYLADIFRAIAFLFQELDSPHELGLDDIVYLDRLLNAYRNLPRQVVSSPRMANMNAYRIFLRDFHHLVSKSDGDMFKQVKKLWERASEETKQICREKAAEENEHRRRVIESTKRRAEQSCSTESAEHRGSE
eukprot:jgi/Antlo1/382/23